MKRTQLTTLLCLVASILYPLVVKDLYFMHMAILIGIYAMGAMALCEFFSIMPTRILFIFPIRIFRVQPR